MVKKICLWTVFGVSLLATGFFIAKSNEPKLVINPETKVVDGSKAFKLADNKLTGDLVIRGKLPRQ